MDEARRFLRYVTPGLSCTLQFVLTCAILAPTPVGNVFTASLSKESSLGLAVTLLIASGGLGYIFSVIHQGVHSQDWLWPTIDHRDLLRRLQRAELLEVVEWTGSGFARAEASLASRADAWVAITSVWRERLSTNDSIRGADAGVVNLLDLMHSAGAARVGAAVAGVGALIVAFNYGAVPSQPAISPLQWFVAGALAVTGVLLHQFNYRRLGDRAERVIEEVLTDALRADKSHYRPRPSTVIRLTPQGRSRWWKA